MSGMLSVLNLSHNNLSLSATDRRPSINILPNHVVEFPVSDVQFDVQFLDDLSSYLTRGVVEVLLDGAVLTAQNLDTLQDISELVDSSTFVPETPGTLVIEVDGSRTDLYTADGTLYRPYKSVEEGVSAANFLATAATPCVVRVAPGTYNVSPITVNSYVKIQGAGWRATVLKASTLTDHFITMSPSTVLRDCEIWGPTSTGKAAVHVGTADPKTVTLNEVAISRGYYGILCNPVGSVGTLLVQNLVHSYKGPGNTIHTMIRVEEFGNAFVALSLVSGPTDTVTHGVCVSGANAVCTLISFYHEVSGSTVGACVNGGAMLRVIGSVFSSGLTALEVGSDGASRLRIQGTTVHRTIGGGYTNDLLVQNAAATVTFTGFMSRDRISNLPDASIIANFVNHEPAYEGACALGELIVGSDDAVLPLLDYGKAAYLTGLRSGGEVTKAGGLVLNVAAGSGYVNDGVQPIKVDWAGTTVTLGSSKAREYVFVNQLGVVCHSETKPDYSTNIVLSRGVTNATDVVLLTQDEVEISHSLSRLADYLEHTVGPLMESGCGTTLNAAPLKVNVSSGVFWVGLSERAVTGGTAVTFTGWYRGPLGTWVAVPGMTEIDDEKWDDGSGVLANVAPGKFTNATLYIAVNNGGEEYHVVYGQEEFVSAIAAQSGDLPLPPNVLKEYACRSAALIVEKSSGVINSVVDVRPQIGQFAAVSGGVAGDHDLLANLANDTHLQYLNSLRADAWHALLPGAHVTNGNTHDHVGGDGAQIDHTGLSNIGTRTHLQLESDINNHIGDTANPHTVTKTQVGLGSVTNDAQLKRAAGDFSTFVAKTPIGADVLLVEDSADGGVKKSALVSSLPFSTLALSAVAPVNVTKAAADVGVAVTAARSDHKHDITTAAPIAVGLSNLEGSSASLARADHVHSGPVFGRDYQTAVSLARSTYNTNTAFQNKVTLTTGALTGTYRVGWTAVIDGSATNQNVEAQLYNNTDAAIVGVVQVFRPTNAAERSQVGGFAEVVFTGSAKDFIIQYRTANTASTVGIADARIEFYRVV